MPSFFDVDGQGLLSFHPPPCAQCPWYQVRCSGPQTLESQYDRDGNLLTCFEPDKLAMLLENLDRRRTPEPPLYPILQGMTPAIPMLCRGLPEDLTLTSPILYGLGLDDILREDGSVRYGSGNDLRKAFHLSPGARLCLLASVKDNRQEEFWHHSDSRRVWTKIKSLGFEFVTTTSFSVFQRQSRSAQLLNLERNFLCADLLAQEKVAVVPLLCEILEEDLRYAVSWLERRTTVRVVGGLAQGWKTDADFEGFVGRMRHIKRKVARPLHFLIVGCSSARRLSILSQELGSVTVVSAKPVFKGVGGEGWSTTTMRFEKQPGTSRSNLVVQNIEEYRKLGARVIESKQAA